MSRRSPRGGQDESPASTGRPGRVAGLHGAARMSRRLACRVACPHAPARASRLDFFHPSYGNFGQAMWPTGWQTCALVWARAQPCHTPLGMPPCAVSMRCHKKIVTHQRPDAQKPRLVLCVHSLEWKPRCGGRKGKPFRMRLNCKLFALPAAAQIELGS